MFFTKVHRSYLNYNRDGTNRDGPKFEQLY